MSLRLSNGGSTITFLQDAKCCVPSCGAVRDHNNMTVPYYTFPSDTILCREWLNEIQLDEDEIGDLSSLHSTLSVCSKHFQHYRGGMKLCINNGTTSSQQSNTNSSTVVSENPQESMPQVKKPSRALKVSTGTQTVNNEWVKIFKEELDLDILYGNHIQCRICASISVQAVNIYNKSINQSNNAFFIQDLINSLMPIEVKPTDTKPLNICVHCIFKLKEYMVLFNRCLKNDKDFESSNECIQSKNKETNPSGLTKNEDYEVILGFELENDTNNTDTSTLNDNNKETTIDEHINKPKLSKLTSKSYDFIKQKTRKHVMKFILSKKADINDQVPRKNLKKNQSSNNTKVIYVKFMTEYVICHGREWINKIHINKDELKYPKETIDEMLKIMHDTMKSQIEKNDSQNDPPPKLSLPSNRIKVTSSQQVQTTPHANIDSKIFEETNETLKENKALKKKWICTRCGLKIDNEEYYTTHIKLCHPKPCRFCGQIVTPYSKLLVHEKEHRQRADGYICHFCGHQFTTNRSLIRHSKQHTNYERFCCKTCNLQFSNGFGLRKHLRQQHKELIVQRKPEEIQKRKQKCPKCLLWLSSKLALRVHMRTHLPIEERMKICPTCNKTFINARRFKLHVETHGPCPIKCPECPRSFPSQEHLDNHLQCHKITEPVYCDICNRYFKSKTTLKNHINRIHQGIQYVQKTFTCIFCKNVFASKDELLKHRNMHTLEEKAQAFAGDEYGKMQCNECNKSFLFKSRLSLHKKYHHSSLCPDCGRYTTGDSMSHYCKIKGSNAFQFSCQYCTKRFSSKQRLNYHERTHGLNYRFQCTVCNIWFAKLSTLKIHNNSHLDSRRNTCNICGKIFKTISTLNNHIKINHQRKDLPNNSYDLSIQDSDKTHNSVSLPSTISQNNNNISVIDNLSVIDNICVIDNLSVTDNISDVIEEIITLTELDYTVSTLQDFNLSETHDYIMPLEFDYLTSIDSSLATPNADSQDFLCFDIPNDINIPQDMNSTNQQLESVDILDLQNLYDESSS